jgi:hypothetical protein
MKDKRRLGEEPLGSERPNALLNEQQAAAACQRIAEGRSIHSVAQEFGVSDSTVAQIWHGRGWTHVEAPRMGDADRSCHECSRPIPTEARTDRMYCSAYCKGRVSGRRFRERKRTARQTARTVAP